MTCQACGRSNPDDAAFCGGCGSALRERLTCPHCGRDAAPDHAFCTGCGTRLAADAPRVPEKEPLAEDGERRHLTVMFADLVGSTRLAEELDPEDMRDLVLAYQSACASAIGRHSGFIARYLGDGVLAYFGYPEAHEDDARLAVSAGLDIVEATSALRATFARDDIAVRVGVHTGEAVVAEMGWDERRQANDVVGETPNVAARLHSAAARDSVVISGATAELVEGWFALESLGELSLAGLSRKVQAHRVRGATDARTRLEVASRRGLTPLVGRGAELETLLAAWDEVRQGAGRVVLISGEPGIGKSRLAREMRERVRADGCTTTWLRCSPYHRSSVLFPLVEHLQRVVGGVTAAPESRLDRLEEELRRAGLPVASAAPLIADLLALPSAGRYPSGNDSLERRKRQTLETIHVWLLGQARQMPVLLIVDDTHWIDPTTVELLNRFFAPEPVRGVLLVATHRVESSSPWVDRPHVRHLALERLQDVQVREIVGHLSRGKALPRAVEDQISSRTDGVPLFVEEVTRSVLESGAVTAAGDRLVATADLPERLIPSTLRESLVARLDRLGHAREIAQVLAVIGREAPAEFIAAVTGLDLDEVDAGLDRLQAADLVRRHQGPNRLAFSLKHWLVQNVAYESLLRSAQRRYHHRIADALPMHMPEVAETQPEFLAHHLMAAGMHAAAIEAFHRAGELAHQRSACSEATAHLSRALELLRRRPDGPERQEYELTLLLALGAPLTAHRGYSAPEVEEVYTRAGDICRSLGGQTPQFFRALYGTWRVHLLRADYTAALDFARQLFELAEAGDSGTQHAAAHRALGSTLFYLGTEPARALHHLEAVTASKALEQARTSFIDDLHDVVDPWITCHAYKAWSLWLLGDAAGARAASDQAITLAERLQHPFTIALALSFDAWLRQFTGDVERCRAHAARAYDIAVHQGFEFWIGWNQMMLGWADAALGDATGGILTMEQGLGQWRAVGSELGTTYFLALIAEAQRDDGRLDEALDALDAAEQALERTGESFWAPELRRLRGDVLHRRGAPLTEVEPLLREALDLARSTSSRALSQRAAGTLAEVWRAHGRVGDAEALIAREGDRAPVRL